MKKHFIHRWQEQNPVLSEKLIRFLNQLRESKKVQVDEMASKLDREVFEEIDCTECANCCKTTPAILTNRDIKRIAAFLKIPPKIFRRKYVLEDIKGELSFNKVPCVFLAEDNRCKVYEIRPASCRDYPHTGSGSFKTRIPLHRLNMNICPATFEIVRRMEKLINP